MRANLKSDRFTIGMLAVYIFLGATVLWRHLPPTDFFRLWAVANDDHIVKDQGLYSVATLKEVAYRRQEIVHGKNATAIPAIRRLLVVYPGGTPLTFSLLRTFSTTRFDADETLFGFLSIAVFSVGFILLFRRLHFSWMAVLVSFVAVTQFFWPFRLDTLSDNFNRLESGALALSILFLASDEPWHNFLSGFLLIFIAALQPRLLLVPLVILLDAYGGDRIPSMRWFMLGLVAAGAVSLLLPLATLGPASSWMGWHRVARLARHLPSYGRSSFLCEAIGFHRPFIFRFTFVIGVVAILARTYLTGGDMASMAVAGTERLQRLAVLSGLAVAIHLMTAAIVFADNALLLLPTLAALGRPRADGRFALNRSQILMVGALVLLGAHPLLRAMGLSMQPYQDPLTFFGCLIPMMASWAAVGGESETAR